MFLVVHSYSESNNKSLEFYCVGESGGKGGLTVRNQQTKEEEEEKKELLRSWGRRGNGRRSRHSTGTRLTEFPPPASLGCHWPHRCTNKQSIASILTERGGGSRTAATVHWKCCGDGRRAQTSSKFTWCHRATQWHKGTTKSRASMAVPSGWKMRRKST